MNKIGEFRTIPVLRNRAARWVEAAAEQNFIIVLIMINALLWGGLGVWCLKNWVAALIKGAIK